MTARTRTLTPPHPYRQRVIDPAFYLENRGTITTEINEILNIAQDLNEGRSPLALAWAEQVVVLQKKKLLPEVSDDLISAAQIGIAVAIHEEKQLDTKDSETSYKYHAILAILAMEDDKNIAFVRSLLLDGGYYLYRTKLSPDALGESTANSF